MEILKPEAQAWVRAREAGVELPAPITEAVAHLEKVDAELVGLPEPKRPPTPESLVAAGTPLDEATTEAERLAQEAATRAETYRIAVAARSRCRGNLNRAVEAHRDELIVGIRPLVTAIIEEARPHAASLTEFAPDYAAAALMRRATAKQLRAFQAADDLEAKFGVLISAWRASWKAATRRGPARHIAQEVPQERWYWENPGAVANDALNGTRTNRSGHQVRVQPTVLGVASEPAEAGFRLARLAEVEEVYRAAHRAHVDEARWKSPHKRRDGKTFGARSI